MSGHQLLSCGLLLGMLGGYWLLLAQGELDEIKTVQADIRSLHTSLSDQEAEASRLEQTQADVDEVERWLTQVQDLYRLEAESPAFLLEVATALRQCALTPQETTPGPVDERPPLHQQSIRVVVHGAFDDLFEFLGRMEQSRPLIRVTDLHVQTAPARGQVRAELTLWRLWRPV